MTQATAVARGSVCAAWPRGSGYKRRDHAAPWEIRQRGQPRRLQRGVVEAQGCQRRTGERRQPLYPAHSRQDTSRQGGEAVRPHGHGHLPSERGTTAPATPRGTASSGLGWTTWKGRGKVRGNGDARWEQTDWRDREGGALLGTGPPGAHFSELQHKICARWDMPFPSSW